MNADVATNGDEIERAIAELQQQQARRPQPAGHRPERIETMDDAVRAAGIDEVPQIAHHMSQTMTAAMDAVAAETEALASTLMDKASELRRVNAQVCEDLHGLLAMGKRLQELTRANRAAYAEVGR